MDFETIRFRNFRNFRSSITIPVSKGITFLVGPNNVGKSNVFRILAIALEQKQNELNNDLDFEFDAQKQVEVEVEMSRDLISKALTGRQNAERFFGRSTAQSVWVNWQLEHGSEKSKSISDQEIFGLVSQSYFENLNVFNEDFQSVSSNMGDNVRRLVGQIVSQLHLPETAFVPSDRHILSSGQPLNRFDVRSVPSSIVLNMNGVVQNLAELDRPHGDQVSRNAQKQKLKRVESFLTYCLEAKSVRLTVPQGLQTIYVSINEVERPLSSVGSGIEQLILIGLGMSEFGERIVMIDEPELHLHPRTQKLMMQYLAKETDGAFIIATHSSSALDAVQANIVRIDSDGRSAEGRIIQNRNDLFSAVRNLGHSASELVQSNFVIWVEGPSDRIYLNHWLSKFAPDIVEGIDFSIMMYGGSVLANHSFEDTSEDFFKALSISRQFAVYADSDKREEAASLKARVERVKSEVETSGGYLWVSDGREIENYIPQSVLEKVVPEFKGATIVAGKFEQVLDGVDKVKFAKRVLEFWDDDWPLDLRTRITELVDRIRAAR